MTIVTYTEGEVRGPWCVVNYIGSSKGRNRKVHLYWCSCTTCGYTRMIQHDVLSRPDVERRARCSACKSRTFITLGKVTKMHNDWIEQICAEHNCNQKCAARKLTKMQKANGYIPRGGFTVRPFVSDEWKAALCKQWR